jgi:hypothetical protein
MNADRPDPSTPARLAKASERLNILAHELHIAVADASGTAPTSVCPRGSALG